MLLSPENGVGIQEDIPALATMAFRCISQTGGRISEQCAARRYLAPVGFATFSRMKRDAPCATAGCIAGPHGPNNREEAFAPRRAPRQKEPSAGDIGIAPIAKAFKKSLVDKTIAFASEMPSALR